MWNKNYLEGDILKCENHHLDTEIKYKQLLICIYQESLVVIRSAIFKPKGDGYIGKEVSMIVNEITAKCLRKLLAKFCGCEAYTNQHMYTSLLRTITGERSIRVS